MDDLDMQALEDRVERLGPSTRSRSTEPMNLREELMHAENHGPKVSVRDPRNSSEAERDEQNATHFPFWSWCEHCVAGKIPDLPHKRRNSYRDVPETQMDYFFTNCKLDSELMTVQELHVLGVRRRVGLCFRLGHR